MENKTLFNLIEDYAVASEDAGSLATVGTELEYEQSEADQISILAQIKEKIKELQDKISEYGTDEYRRGAANASSWTSSGRYEEWSKETLEEINQLIGE